MSRSEITGCHCSALLCYAGQHIYEVIEIASRLKLTVIPVLDENKNFMGMIGQSDLLGHFASLTAAGEQGGIIVLEMNHLDYSLSQISQIVEGNNARVLSLYIKNTEDSNRIEVTIKTNTTDLTSILQTFERYDYHIKAYYMDNENLSGFTKTGMISSSDTLTYNPHTGSARWPGHEFLREPHSSLLNRSKCK
jgi:CBS domain-containing protein